MTGLEENAPRTAGAIWWQVIPVWAGLAVLLALTLLLAYVPMGRLNLVVSLGIAAAKAGLVMAFFMQLRRPDPLLRLAAFVALVFVAFMLTLTFTDLLSRATLTQPGTVTPRSLPDMPVTGQRAF
ncbi:cytochrome C oxidase subunit IV family protein [Siccirubricoccus sp. KC 17139]|uniref:Cytochrome C oxidase subunit IV family protein n=1 Tax=Siccirubricoccus soli TaxID=2899147 RepID=A0ABT1D9L5_9PROT|nr:cytochrome C oxidase subunit IV family protein [Siccirubricoccus soli]MCO6417955.1 cytochrome C oxidase subunit IV family protein [Siccirubricoccus soli]MCP2684090.1 cytochrome C oxidase subunit IV family protein [Siccirubricoccus soli]